MFIMNRWYVAGWSREITGQPIGRTLLGEPVVLYRGANGKVVALEDRCCHRNLPLSHGAVEGDCIACGYHGMVYDGSGVCIRVPGQDAIPSGARIRSFPVREKDGVLWIWPGDAAKADADLVPDYPFHMSPQWAHKDGHYVVRCHHELINDNLLDLTHVGYVHGKTIGGTPAAHSEAEMRTEQSGDSVVVRRWMPNSVPPPTHVRLVGFQGRIDRWMDIRFIPGLICIYIGANDAGKGVDEVGQMDRLGIRIFNGITPETESTTHYFWTAAHNFRIDEPEVTAAFHSEIAATFEEDRIVVEAQQERYAQFPDRHRVNIRGDAGGVQARRIIARLIAAESGSTEPQRVQ